MSSSENNPVVESLYPVINNSLYVNTDKDQVSKVASWMAYEEFPLRNSGQVSYKKFEAEEHIKSTMLMSCINFAFTDFNTQVKYEAEHNGTVLSDSEAVIHQVNNAIATGYDISEGEVMAGLSLTDLENIFVGNIEMPMLKERVEILNSVGNKLVDSYEGSWIKFINSCPSKLYYNGEGLVEKLVSEFPRFNDVVNFQGNEVKFYKLAQLGYWGLYASLGNSDYFKIQDIHRMSAFADYIVPVALRLFGIINYVDELEKEINEGIEIPESSNKEIEIRAHSLYATALLTKEINKLRPTEKSIIIPQLDWRLWKTYHATHWPHHLTKTIMY
ncbi:MAG: hypothetical protein EVA28_00020 [Candidatus Actinomarinales bacterium]|nr:MAG: hypothetical protein EVA28_00020 [Candidatus Actinomarinales bacterium]